MVRILLLWTVGIAGLVSNACGTAPSSAPVSGAPAAPAATDGPAQWAVDAGPALPSAIANNAVAGAVVDGQPWIFSFLGLGTGRDFRAITTAAYALDVASGRWNALPDVPGRVGRLAAKTELGIDIGQRPFGRRLIL